MKGYFQIIRLLYIHCKLQSQKRKITLQYNFTHCQLIQDGVTLIDYTLDRNKDSYDIVKTILIGSDLKLLGSVFLLKIAETTPLLCHYSIVQTIS